MTTICVLTSALSLAQGKSKLITNLESGKKQTLVAYGTSLTASSAWVRQLQDLLNRNYPSMATVINSGKDAMSSKWGVDNLEELVIQRKPNTVLMEFAVNDAYLPYKTSVADARRNLENMIDRILKADPNCEVILMVMNPPIADHLKLRPQFKDYYQMYRDVARELKLKLIDHYPNWEAILTKDKKLFMKYIPDGIHPSPDACKSVIIPKILESLGMSD